ncbi:hypothetical protein JTB14_012530 [Gonioctena quinquepunctata]|nr:hypothetical protein JTB14_012530 [Gonioctena quinquepunctata]
MIETCPGRQRWGEKSKQGWGFCENAGRIDKRRGYQDQSQKNEWGQIKGGDNYEKRGTTPVYCICRRRKEIISGIPKIIRKYDRKEKKLQQKKGFLLRQQETERSQRQGLENDRGPNQISQIKVRANKPPKRREKGKNGQKRGAEQVNVNKNRTAKKGYG